MTERTPVELREQRARLIAATGLTETVLRERAGAHHLYPEHHDIWVTVEGIDYLLGDARSDVGTEFIRQADNLDEAALAAFEADLDSSTAPKVGSKDRPEDDPDVLRERLATAVDERDRARRWAVSLENENRRLVDQAREAKEQARVATVAALNLQRQTPEAAQRTLGRIREARTWVGVWIELGQYFGLTAEQCGVEARARRRGDSL